MLRFQHLIDSRTRFKVASNLLSTEERNYLTSYFFNRVPADVKSLFVTFNTDGSLIVKYSSRESSIDYPGTHHLFVPPTEPTLSNVKIFEMYLKKHRAFSAFKRVIAEEDHGFSYKDYINERRDISQCISQAITWQNTPQGHAYWLDLRDGWVQMVSYLNLNNR